MFVCMNVGMCVCVCICTLARLTCKSIPTLSVCSPTAPSNHSEPPAPASESSTIIGDRYEAIYPFPGEASGDLSFKEGDIILVTKKDGDWWTGVIGDKKGVFPCNYVQEMDAGREVVNREPEGNTSMQSAPNHSHSASSAGSKDIAAAAADSSRQDPAASVSVMTQPLIARVKVAFQAEQDTQLSLNPGELIKVMKQASNGWWVGELQSRGKQRRSGWFPANRVELLASKAPSVNVSEVFLMAGPLWGGPF